MTFQTFTGREYLKIDIANNFGLDKDEWEDRIAWFDANIKVLEQITDKAEEPALFAAGVRAWRNVERGGVNHYPISLDATSSGIQLLACLTGDRKAGELCNIVDIGTRADGYTILYTDMTVRIGDTAKIDRTDTKSAIMTAFYGSEAEPKRVFGEGRLLSIFEETMSDRAPAAWELNKAMLAIWDAERIDYRWVMPNNFHAGFKVMAGVSETVHMFNKPYEIEYTVQMGIEKGRSLCANMTHSVDGMVVAEMQYRCSYDASRMHQLKMELQAWNQAGTALNTANDELVKTLWEHYEESGFLSARILKYLNSGNMGHVDGNVVLGLIDRLPAKPFDVISVHDCFRCLPNYGNDLRWQYNSILADIAKSDLLSFILSQIMGKIVKIAKHDKNLWKDVQHANYPLS